LRVLTQLVTKLQHGGLQGFVRGVMAFGTICVVAGFMVSVRVPVWAGDQTPKPYNQGNIEINLFQIETKRLVRSVPVSSPDTSRVAFTEVIYLPNARQTVSKLYVMPTSALTPLPKPPDAPAPAGGYYGLTEPPRMHWWQVWRSKNNMPVTPQATPEEQKQQALQVQAQPRNVLYSVGLDEQERFKFETLTVVDWSAGKNKLLFKRKNGILYTGLKTSDILVFDPQQGTISIYPELKRVIAYQWDKQHLTEPLGDMEWDIEPLGWKPGSDTEVLVKAYAYDKTKKVFLGTYQYDITTAENAVITMQEQPVRYAVNGMRVDSESFHSDNSVPRQTETRPQFPELLQ